MGADRVIASSRGRVLRIAALVLVPLALLLWGPVAFGISMTEQEGSNELGNPHPGPALLVLAVIELGALVSFLVSVGLSRQRPRIGLAFAALSVALAGGLVGLVTVGSVVG